LQATVPMHHQSESSVKLKSEIVVTSLEVAFYRICFIKIELLTVDS